ncbi:MAG: transcriptional regulator, MarR family [Anaerosolibacter sp.]|uniref:MarR family winged helix-turn-helix transcriptional regulator n=1 Tax=Anaerosolibacter sp. TaxID=1872527 RepID=UPI0026385531|nr:MarR family transcriptional regulator [Anaerosolibacter sp.]MDF2545136.1 transcriptional regulator, MarR family [Anaerosolibacter sp.]
MRESIIASADAVSRFCRLQMNIKKEIPIRSSEMGVLIYVEKSDVPVTPLMISNFFGISKPSVTDMVNALLKNNYLSKTLSQTDKRSYSLSVTQKGHELVESTYSEYFRTMELLEEKMGYHEFELFIQLIGKANRVLSEERE